MYILPSHSQIFPLGFFSLYGIMSVLLDPKSSGQHLNLFSVTV